MTATTIFLARRASLLVLVLFGGVVLAVLALGDGARAHAQEHGDEEGCMACHEELREVLDREVPHEPALDEDCVLCHDPHAARFEHLLNRRERALCFTCHQDERLEFQKGIIHTPIREGKCVVCHEVHGSEHAGLLKAEGNELCFGCHEDKAAQTQLATVHEPFVDGECLDCHTAHNSPHENQLQAPATALCGLCHQPEEEELVEAHSGIPIAGTRCTSCHDVHASASDGLLLPSAHQPFAEGDCDMCHMLDTETPQVVRATGGRLCLVCHKDYPPKGAPVVHQPVSDGNCGACHTSHASTHAGLLTAEPSATCLRCHEEIEQRAATSRTVHPLKMQGEGGVEGGSCTACHQPHSSKEGHLLIAGEIRTCIACHETQLHGHPLGDDRVDPRTGQAITCVTCHDPHGTAYPMQLRGDQTRGLCIECHTSGGDDGSGGNR